jgi:hypothetical protein
MKKLFFAGFDIGLIVVEAFDFVVVAALFTVGVRTGVW